MKRKLLSAALAVALGAGAGYVLNASAQQKPEVLVKQRQSAMTLIGKYWGPLAGMMQGKAPFDAAVATRNAHYLEVLAQMPWDGFAESTKDSPEKNRALPAIWAEGAKFKEAQERLQTSTAKLAQSTKDEGAFKAAAGEVGKACGNCHDNFRSK